MFHTYTEDQLVEQPAIGLFAELGWTVAEPPPNTTATRFRQSILQKAFTGALV